MREGNLGDRKMRAFGGGEPVAAMVEAGVPQEALGARIGGLEGAIM